ncbi:Imidazole glycerol phosphate synthase amidotransferase subunit [Candidatus Rhodobacter oscarellae]|uniref:Imidazole glycerol phosphate synthase subunit HisH n=1 Tax=Candidatus Rhodobacter oscarellae TaxID=1675527 RepID=A0A0J9H253_9RHOB|nr:imidazole glycerol phosphate synthase subunit HisH [Candidatus Rhodobacter lobularis]KMW59788.1 Imidazole glycerol phosphate synthase amidotransferase subunit [Candidatus Rhodobacter lobularis]
MLTAIIDYDSGNLHSAQKAFERMAREAQAGEVVVTSDADVVARADRIVLPGDGAFPACKAALFAVDGVAEAMREAVVSKGRPFLGICVGMQMLASRGHEYETVAGLDWIGGDIRPIAPQDPALKVPHMGWNDLVVRGAHPVLDGIKTGDHAYFVHSYQFEVAEPAERLAHCDYGAEITAIVGRGNIIGTQFHPEKSQSAGLRLISNFLRWAP